MPTNNTEQQSQGRLCVYVDETMLVEGHGYRPSFVVENVAGHRPNGTWPYHGKVGETLPWFWGKTATGYSIDAAKKQAADYNKRLGLTEKDVENIITSSIRAQELSKRKK